MLDNGFTNWEDNKNITENLHYRGLGWTQLRWMSTATLFGHWTPVTWLTLGLDYVVWGMKPSGYHLTSLLLHAACAALFYLLALRLLGLAAPEWDPSERRRGAILSALFFALQPLRVQSVAWITERRDLTSGLFFLLAVTTYLKAQERPGERGRHWLWASIGFAALALASKAMVMGLPLVLILLDVYPLRRLGRDRDWVSARTWPVWREKLPFVMLAIATAAIAFHVQRSSGLLTSMDRFPLVARMAMSFYSLWFHLWKTVLPLNLSPVYEAPAHVNALDWPFVVSAIMVLAISATCWLLRRRWPVLLATWLFYAVMLAPVSGLVHAGNTLGADHYTYVPCMGFAFLVGLLLVTTIRARACGSPRPPMVRMMVAVMALWLTVLGWMTSKHVQIWRDSETLWTWAIELNPDCEICASNLGVTLSERGDLARAVGSSEPSLALQKSLATVPGKAAKTLHRVDTRLGEPIENDRTRPVSIH
jgi:protein O-mannosyl-transferase